jgi:hypothetical protein
LARRVAISSRCAMVMVQRAELEAELAHGLSQIAPQVIAKHYLVVGTSRCIFGQRGGMNFDADSGSMIIRSSREAC